MARLLGMVALLAARVREDERGATAVEYGLLVAFIAVVIIGAVTLLGTELEQMYCDIVNGMAGAGTCVP